MDVQETASELLAALGRDSPGGGPACGRGSRAGRLDVFCERLEGALVGGGGGDPNEVPTADASAAVGRCAVELRASLLAAAGVERAAACDLSDEIAGGLFDGSSPATDGADPATLASLLRTAGLFLRWSSLLDGEGAGRLSCPCMLRLYAGLLDESPPAEGPKDVGRFASICIFRSTYGAKPLNSRARKVFVEELDGCRLLVRALMRGGQPAGRLFTITRNVHHLVAACPREAVPGMERAVEECGLEEDKRNGVEEAKESCAANLTDVLSATLSWAVNSEPALPGGQDDRRADLALEALRAMYALSASGLAVKPSQEAVAEIGATLCDVLSLSSADERCYQCKLAVVNLLLDAPKGYSRYLVENGAVPHLVDVLSYQTSLVVVERTGSSANDAAAVVPVLLALLRIVKADEEALEIVRREVFPPDSESAFRELADAEILMGNGEGRVRAKNMAPLDAPRGTLRWRLVKLMTWLESNVKRASCELLYALCGEDGTEFVLRTGFGNAVHFLGVRGAVSLPQGVDV